MPEGADPLICVFHGPPYGTALDQIARGVHVGSHESRRFLSSAAPSRAARAISMSPRPFQAGCERSAVRSASTPAADGKPASRGLVPFGRHRGTSRIPCWGRRTWVNGPKARMDQADLPSGWTRI
jgi:hypothetical protein